MMVAWFLYAAFVLFSRMAAAFLVTERTDLGTAGFAPLGVNPTAQASSCCAAVVTNDEMGPAMHDPYGPPAEW